MSNLFFRSLVVAVALTVSSSLFAAEGLLPALEAAALSQVAAASEPAAPARFSAGSWDIGVYGGALGSINGAGSTIFFGAVAPEYYIWDGFAVVGEFVGFGIDQRDTRGEDGIGAGFSLLARWHFLKFAGDRAALYFEGGAGVTYWDTRVPPPSGTHFNFSPQAGVGLKWLITDGCELIVGGRYLHLSNAAIFGDNRNPGLDTIGGYGGVVLNF